MKTLVLGLGNTIMTDDGIGPKAIESLQNTKLPDSGVVLLDGGTLGLDLLPHLEGAGRLIILDAVELGREPGSLVRLVGDEVPLAIEHKLSPHQMGLKDLLAVASLMGCLPDKVVLLGVQPACLELGTELSPAVSEALPELCKLVMAELA